MNTFSDSAVTALHLITSLDPGLWTIAGRSLGVSATACFLGCVAGIALGAFLGVSKFAGRTAVLTVLNTFLALPSVVVGLVIYLLLSRTGPLGFLGWLFSFKAMVLAQFILVVPVAAALSRQVVEDVEWPTASNGGLWVPAMCCEASYWPGTNGSPCSPLWWHVLDGPFQRLVRS